MVVPCWPWKYFLPLSEEGSNQDSSQNSKSNRCPCLSFNPGATPINNQSTIARNYLAFCTPPARSAGYDHDITRNKGNRALVVANLEDPTAFLERLVGIQEHKNTTVPGVLAYGLSLDTKYYTADVELWVTQSASYPLDTSSAESTADLLGESCQALLLVFDKDTPASFDRLKGWATYAEEYGPSVQLCVATTSRRGKDERNNEHGRVITCQDWCVENGFEFISVDVAGDDDEDAVEKPHENGEDDETPARNDKQGRYRVIEALEANMWPDMKMKPRGAPAAAVRQDDEVDRGGEEGGEGGGGEKEEVKVERKAKSEVVVEGEGEKEGEVVRGRPATESLIAQFDEEEDELVMSLLRGKRAEEARERKEQGGEKTPGAGDGSGVEEVISGDMNLGDDESFEKALSRLGALREQAAKLPDEERREMAARVALMFASMLGFNENEDK